MPSTLFLTRKDGAWSRYDAVTEVSLTGGSVVYSGITGDAGTDVITITGATLTDGQMVVFSSVTNGVGLDTGVAYFLRDVSGSTAKLAATLGGSVVDFTTNLTDGTLWLVADELRVWSSEFRDIFTSTTGGATGSSSVIFSDLYFADRETITPGSPTVIGRGSDEVMHRALRQSQLNQTHWKIDRGTSIEPRYIYAHWQPGDRWADHQPETNDD